MRLTIIAIMLSVSSFAQCGRNFDFSFGDFTGWQGDSGSVQVDNLLQTSWTVRMANGIFNYLGYWNNNHQIVSGSALDPNTCYFVPMVCPYGGTYSARLGNTNAYCFAEGLSYTAIVDPLNPIFVYAFAPVLQDPNHPDYAQPSFASYVKNAIGDTIPCTYYRVTATNLRGQVYCNDRWANIRVYRNWRSVAIDLSPYAGQNVTIHFKTTDCGYCAHYGYAYIDMIGCYPKEIGRICNNTGSLLTAPPGFDSYLWSTGETTQSIFNTSAQTITCTMTTSMGCSIVLSAVSGPCGGCPPPYLSMITHN